jgi:hypothetical protein
MLKSLYPTTVAKWERLGGYYKIGMGPRQLSPAVHRIPNHGSQIVKETISKYIHQGFFFGGEFYDK